MKVAFHTLGCKVNQYESEALAEKFKDCGYDVVDENDFADIYVVNTCTVTALADRKSRQYIRKMKKKNPGSIVAVTGCYAQIKPEEISKVEGVNVIAGTNEKENLITYIEEYMEQERDRQKSLAEKDLSCKHSSIEKHIKKYEELTEYRSSGIIEGAEGRTRAYIKIEEGCNRFCSYCVIPYARGAVRSRNEEEILEEAESLIKKGYKEIVLTGINTALYGTEKDGSLQLDKLLKKLNDIPGNFRIRLSSLEPTVVDSDYVKKLLTYDKLCHHLHLSLQSGSDKVLREMNRNYDREDYLKILKVLRKFDAEFGITTDIIAGFPGETEEDFSDSLSMIKEAKFCRVHAFPFSLREETAAAGLKTQISPGVKKERAKALAKAGNEASQKFFGQNIGKTRSVLMEEFLEDEGVYTGYTDNYIKVYVQGSHIMLNQFYSVKLSGIYGDGMTGEPV